MPRNTISEQDKKKHAAYLNKAGVIDAVKVGGMTTGAVPFAAGLVVDSILTAGKGKFFRYLLGGLSAIPGGLGGLLASPVRVAFLRATRHLKYANQDIVDAAKEVKDFDERRFDLLVEYVNKNYQPHNQSAHSATLMNRVFAPTNLNANTSNSMFNLLISAAAPVTYEMKCGFIASYLRGDKEGESADVQLNQGKSLLNAIMDGYTKIKSKKLDIDSRFSRRNR